MDRQQTERTPRKFFRCVSVDNLISKFSKPPEDNEIQRKKIHFNERGNCASQKEFENSDNDKYQNIYAYMAGMSGND